MALDKPVSAGRASSRDFQWYVNADLDQYKGEYIIILDEHVVYHGPNLAKLLRRFRKEYPNQVPKVAKIPLEETLVLGVPGFTLLRRHRRAT
jgi:hypothetical protein